MINRFLIVGFNLWRSLYHSLILCKEKNDVIEYRITVMNGEIEKHLCKNNVLKEMNGYVEIELSGNNIQDQIKLKIAKALCRKIRKPLRQVEKI